MVPICKNTVASWAIHPCSGHCTGYGAHAGCPPLIVIAIQQQVAKTSGEGSRR